MYSRPVIYVHCIYRISGVQRNGGRQPVIAVTITTTLLQCQMYGDASTVLRSQPAAAFYLSKCTLPQQRHLIIAVLYPQPLVIGRDGDVGTFIIWSTHLYACMASMVVAESTDGFQLEIECAQIDFCSHYFQSQLLSWGRGRSCVVWLRRRFFGWRTFPDLARSMADR